jgi:excisionase family DNA binding protein
MTTADAAQVLGCREDYVAYLCRTGRITAEMPGRDWVIDPASVDEYREGQQAGKIRRGRPRK